jgi:hypothetical protein
MLPNAARAAFHVAEEPATATAPPVTAFPESFTATERARWPSLADLPPYELKAFAAASSSDVRSCRKRGRGEPLRNHLLEERIQKTGVARRVRIPPIGEAPPPPFPDRPR